MKVSGFFLVTFRNFFQRLIGETVPDVKMAGEGSTADVEPVLVERSEFFVRAGLHDINPLGNLHLARLFQKD